MVTGRELLDTVRVPFDTMVSYTSEYRGAFDIHFREDIACCGGRTQHISEAEKSTQS